CAKRRKRRREPAAPIVPNSRVHHAAGRGIRILVLNPGGNSLKVQLVRCHSTQRHAYEGEELLSVSIEGIGKEPRLSLLQDKAKYASEPIEAENVEQAVANFLRWWQNHA